MVTKADIAGIFEDVVDISVFTKGTYQLQEFPMEGNANVVADGGLLITKPNDMPSGIMVGNGELVVKVTNYGNTEYITALKDVIMTMVLQPIVKNKIYAMEIINEFNKKADNDDDKIGGSKGISVDNAVSAINRALVYKGIHFIDDNYLPDYLKSYSGDVDKFKEVILDIMNLFAQGTGLASKMTAIPVKLYGYTDPSYALFEKQDAEPIIYSIAPVDAIEQHYDTSNNVIKYANVDDSNATTLATAYLQQKGVDAVNAIMKMLYGLITDSVGATAYGLSKDHINDYAVTIVEDYLNSYDFPTNTTDLKNNLDSVEYYEGDTLDTEDIGQKLQAIHNAGYEALQLGAGLVTTNTGGVATAQPEEVNALTASVYTIIFREFSKGYANYIMNNADNKGDLTSSTVESNCWDKTFPTFVTETTLKDYNANHYGGQYFEILDIIPILAKHLDSDTVCTGIDNDFESYATFLKTFSDNNFYTPLKDSCTAILDMLPSGADGSVYDSGATSAKSYLDNNSNKYPTDGTKPDVDISPISWEKLIPKFNTMMAQIYNSVTLNRSHSSN